MANKLTKIAREILSIEADLPYRLDCTSEKPTVDDFHIYIFEQAWGSTALGFDRIGGQAITSAFTYVLVPENCDQKCFVYFAGRYAYAVDYSDILAQDIYKQNMASVSKVGKYKVR